jgi:hypothetical protein
MLRLQRVKVICDNELLIEKYVEVGDCCMF